MKAKITQDEQNPHAVEIIADSIVQIAAAMRKVNASRLTQDAIVTLIARHSHVPRKDIEIVLANMTGLENRWLKKPVISKTSNH